jgi:hypothetical protein
MTDQTPINTPEQHSVLIDNIGKYLVGMIEGIVERKVNEIFDSHATMTLINEKTEERLREIAEAVIDVHEGDFEHHSTDDISDTVATYVHNIDLADKVKYAVHELMSDGDYATEDRVQEMIDESDYVTESRVHEMVEEQVQEAIDEHDYEESVKQVLRNI